MSLVVSSLERPRADLDLFLSCSFDRHPQVPAHQSTSRHHELSSRHGQDFPVPRTCRDRQSEDRSEREEVSLTPRFPRSSTLVSKLTKRLLSPCSFFRYCHVNLSRYPQKDRPEDSLAIPTTRLGTRAGFGGGAGNKHPGASTDEEVELISEYSWRNFFSAINRTKIIQKLLKGRSEKIYQFNQHKPFVRLSSISFSRVENES